MTRCGDVCMLKLVRFAMLGDVLEKCKVLLLSTFAQGGVGKTTVCANMARCLALREEVAVGVLDIDLCGPSMPRSLVIPLSSSLTQGAGV